MSLGAEKIVFDEIFLAISLMFEFLIADFFYLNFKKTRHRSYFIFFVGGIILFLTTVLVFIERGGVSLISIDLSFKIMHYAIITILFLWYIAGQLFFKPVPSGRTIIILLFGGFLGGTILFSPAVKEFYNPQFKEWVLQLPLYFKLFFLLFLIIFALEFTFPLKNKIKTIFTSQEKIAIAFMISGFSVFFFNYFIYRFFLEIVGFVIPITVIVIFGWFLWSLGTYINPLTLVHSWSSPIVLFVVDKETNQILGVYFFQADTTIVNNYGFEKILLFSQALNQASIDIVNKKGDIIYYNMEGYLYLLKKNIGKHHEIVLLSIGQDRGIRSALNYFADLISESIQSLEWNKISSVIKIELDFVHQVYRSFGVITYDVQENHDYATSNKGIPSISINDAKKGFYADSV